MKSLVATPSVLTMMSYKTRLDAEAWRRDSCTATGPDGCGSTPADESSGKQQVDFDQRTKVSVTQQQNKQVIVIEPTAPDTVYVPYYDPAVVYGGWPYPAYPPYYFPPPVDMFLARSLLPGLHSAPAMQSGAGRRAEITGAAASTGAATTST